MGLRLEKHTPTRTFLKHHLALFVSFFVFICSQFTLASPNQCDESLSKAGDTYSSSRQMVEGKELKHIILDEDGKASKWEQNFVRWLADGEDLNRVWPATSFRGGIWTSIEDYWDGEGVLVSIKLKSGKGFFAATDEHHAKHWDKWKNDNSEKLNEFLEIQKNKIEIARTPGFIVPSHSGFYRDYQLAGVYRRYLERAYHFVIYDFHAVESITISRSKGIDGKYMIKDGRPVRILP